jgi:hypothetical protein
MMAGKGPVLRPSREYFGYFLRSRKFLKTNHVVRIASGKSPEYMPYFPDSHARVSPELKTRFSIFQFN